MDKQLSLFNTQEYGGKKVRGPYNIKPKVIELSLYQKLNNILSQIANYLPSPIFKDEEEFIFPYVKLWNSKYSIKPYKYQKKFFYGEDYNIIEAELIGTESFSIEDRISLHSILLEKLEKGINITEAAEKLQPLIEYFKKRYTYKKGDLYIWLKKHRLRG